MEILYDASCSIDALTIGYFDGCHLGHQFLFSVLSSLPGVRGILTFDQHPHAVLYPDTAQPLIFSNQERLFHLCQTNLDYLLVLPFTKQLANQTAIEFLKFLKTRLHLKVLVLGHDSKLGRDRWDPLQVKIAANQLDLRVIHVSPYLIQNEVASSNKIRKLLSQGNLAQANAFLGYAYSFQGVVSKGAGIGGTLGIKTINLCLNSALLPLGVYACEVYVNTSKYFGVMNLGYAPTMNRRSLCVEAHIFSFQEKIYNQEVRIVPLKFLRSEQLFSSKEDLKKAILQDIEVANNFFNQDSTFNYVKKA